MRAAPRERLQLKPTGVEEIIQTDVVTVERNTPISTVVAEMADKDVGSVVVVDDETPIGVITDRGIALSLHNSQDISDRTANQFITGELVAGTSDMSVFDVLRRLDEENIRRLPIVDEDNTLQGIVTLDDIIVFLDIELQSVASIIRAQSPRL